MKRPVLLFLLVFLGLPILSKVTLLENGDNWLILEYSLESYSLSKIGDQVRIEAPGYDYPLQAGAPLIPKLEVKTAVPPGGEIRIDVLSSQTKQIALDGRLLPVPSVTDAGDISEHKYIVDEEHYKQNIRQLIQILPRQTFRGISFIPMEIRPFLYDGETSLEVITNAIFKINILGEVQYRGLPEIDHANEVIYEQLLNPNQAQAWQNNTRSPVNNAPFGKSDHWLRLETNRDAMFRITPAQLSSFPLTDIDPRSFRLFSTGGNLLPFTIINPGPEFAEIPIRVIGEEDGVFDPQDYIVFPGTTRDGLAKNQTLQTSPTFYNPYSGNAVFWLTFAGEFDAPPLRMTTKPTLTSWVAQTPSSQYQVRLETESQRREVVGFTWYMSRLFGSSTAEYQYNIELPDLDTTKPATLSFIIRQEDVDNNIWHNISVSVNNTPVVADTTSGSQIFRWIGTGEYQFNKPSNSFISGTNNIKIKVIRTGTDNLFLNWLGVSYERMIVANSGQTDVKQFALNYNVPVRYDAVGDHTVQVYQSTNVHDVAMVPIQPDGSDFYFVAVGSADTQFLLARDADLLTPQIIGLVEPTDLTAQYQPVDNVIIVADEFASQVQNLPDLYLDKFNQRSILVKQSEIFNQFNGGHPDPVAIRQFLRYAYHNFPLPRLSSVTLIGLGSIDWRNFSGQAADKNKLIVFQRNQITSDDYFVMLTQSSYPELAVGRYPVRNSTELGNMLSNLNNYVGNNPGGWWKNSMVMLGDDLFNGSSTSYENIHTRQTEDAANVVHPSVLVDKIFAWEYEYDEFQNKPRARDDMIAAINEGRLVWYYIGHGSYDKLGAEDYFNGASDMGRFNNPNRLPFFMAASCKVSHFDYWGFESLGQKTVLLNNLGAIASYSATRVSAPYSNAPMMQFLLDRLANKRNPVGMSIMGAKIQYTQSDDNDATYVLLGDPLLRITPPVRDSLMTISGNDPLTPETLNARELAQIDGSFSPSSQSGVGEVKVFNTKTEYNLDWQTRVSHRGAPLFEGRSTVNQGSYISRFIVPDDVTTGNSGLVVSYLWDPLTRQDYVNYMYPLPLSDQAVTSPNTDNPVISIYLGSMDFRPGDTVGSNPTLYARISDSDGINVTGSASHNILLILDNSPQPIPVTRYFSYDVDSYTAGTLMFPLSNLTEGAHSVQIIAFDNFNQPSVASTSFVVKKTGELAIERFLIYPNPMQRNTSFTFMLSQNCDLVVEIYTMTGKKIRTIEALGRQGFNSIFWDGRDSQGAWLANNTYFVKIRASKDGIRTEAIERLVIFN